MSAAVFFEAVATWLMARKTVGEILGGDDQKVNGVKKPVSRQLTLRSISRFYYPLALTSILSLGVHPFVTFFLGKSKMAIESLAVLPVVTSLVFIFRSMGLSYQEVNIALIGENRQNSRLLRNFATALGVAVTVGVTLIAFTPLASFWFVKLSGLTTELANLSYLPLKILILLPAMSVLLSYQRSVLVIEGRTGPISGATAIELASIIVILLVCVVYLDMIGVVAASIAFITGKVIANIYLGPRQLKAVRGWSIG
jgi:hypothetical protein